MTGRTDKVLASTPAFDARSKMEDWRNYYNEVRPHGAIGNKPPITLQDYEGMPSSPS